MVLSSLLEGGLLGLCWDLGLGVVGLALVVLFLVNTDIFLPKSAETTPGYLESAVLKTTTGDIQTIKAQSLWERDGAIIMAEAFELSSLKPQLDELGVPLYAVVKEDIGTEIQSFRPYFNGEIFVDEKQRFYGSKPRRMGLGLGLSRLTVWRNLLRAQKKGYQGNKNGEGFVLGGVYVLGAGKQGLLLEHQEKEFGNKAELTSVMEAAKKIQKGN